MQEDLKLQVIKYKAACKEGQPHIYKHNWMKLNNLKPFTIHLSREKLAEIYSWSGKKDQTRNNLFSKFIFPKQTKPS